MKCLSYLSLTMVFAIAFAAPAHAASTFRINAPTRADALAYAAAHPSMRGAQETAKLEKAKPGLLARLFNPEEDQKPEAALNSAIPVAEQTVTATPEAKTIASAELAR